MPWNVLGAGLVGSFLGAAGGAAGAIGRTGVAARVRLPTGEIRHWTPGLAVPGPCLVATRCHRTPWADLPAGDLLAAQNGVGQPIPVAVCYMAIDADPDGCLVAEGVVPRVVLKGGVPAWKAVIASWREAGLVVQEVADVRPYQWEKALLNATVGPLCLATGLGMAEVWSRHRAEVLAATREGACVARACGIDLPEDPVAVATAFFDRVRHHRPSVLRDPGELAWILDPLVRGGQDHGIAVPALTAIASAVAWPAGGR